MEPHTGFNNLDYVVLGVILLSGLLALMRGFLREVFSLVTWVAAYYAAATYYPMAEPWARRYIKNPSTATDIAAVAVFCLTFIVLTILGSLIASLVRGQALTAIDRSLGFVFGLLRGALVVCLIYLVAASILWPDLEKPPHPAQAAEVPPVGENQAAADKDKNPAPEWLMNARTRPMMAYGAAELKTMIPGNVLDKTYLDQKSAAQHLIDRETLNNLSVPGITPTSGQATGADDKNRLDINQLVNPQGSP